MRIFLLFSLLITSTVCAAGPGAHGPNGEHLDTPAGQAVTGPGAPRVEAVSESFEVLGRLYDEELSILVDRFETNEPVRDAKVEAVVNGIKAVAQFHADHGDYSFTEPALLNALRKPGRHPVVFTVLAGKESDLLEGTLEVAAAGGSDDAHRHGDHDHAHDHSDDHGHEHGWEHGWEKPAIVIGAFLLATVVGLFMRRRAHSRKD